jgi:drug/metabolite transporter (DMT)-like permease
MGASLLAYVLLHEAPSPWTMADGAVILASLALVAHGERR